MKQFVFIAFCLFLLPTSSRAETLYVKDIVKITLRTGPGIDYKIIAMIQSGQDVEVLKPEEGWTLVRLPNGKEGWVLSRLLTSRIPNSLLLRRLQKEHQELMVEAASQLKKIAQLKEENKNLRSELASNNIALNKLSESYKNLKKDSAGFLKLKSDYQKAIRQLDEQTNVIKKLEKELQRKYITVGLCGAAVLLLGFIIGFSARRQRRRPSLL